MRNMLCSYLCSVEFLRWAAGFDIRCRDLPVSVTSTFSSCSPHRRAGQMCALNGVFTICGLRQEKRERRLRTCAILKGGTNASNFCLHGVKEEENQKPRLGLEHFLVSKNSDGHIFCFWKKKKKGRKKWSDIAAPLSNSPYKQPAYLLLQALFPSLTLAGNCFRFLMS
jgi:hypothetical protein